MKKILFLTIDFPPMSGGMARHSESVTLALKKIGYKVIVIAPSTDGDATYDKCAESHVCRVRGIVYGHIFDHYLKSVMHFFGYGMRFCFPYRVNMIIANTWSIAGVSAFLIHKITGIPYVVFANGFDVYAPKFNQKANWLMRVVLRDAVYVIAISNFTRQLVIKTEKNANTIIINPCVETARFMTDFKIVASLKNSHRKIITVARLVKSKGHDTVLKALPKVIERFPDTKYFIIGEGPEENNLKELARELGLSQYIVFTGQVDEAELILHYRTCDLFILTSREIETNGEVEGFGIVFLEAGACGKPVIGARSGGIQDAVIDKMTGILVDPSDISGTSEAIIKLLSDEELRNRLGKNGKIRVEKELNMTVFAEKLQMVLTNNLHYDEKKD